MKTRFLMIATASFLLLGGFGVIHATTDASRELQPANTHVAYDPLPPVYSAKSVEVAADPLPPVYSGASVNANKDPLPPVY
jgi:hypothetical protein